MKQGIYTPDVALLSKFIPVRSSALVGLLSFLCSHCLCLTVTSQANFSCLMLMPQGSLIRMDAPSGLSLSGTVTLYPIGASSFLSSSSLFGIRLQTCWQHQSEYDLCPMVLRNCLRQWYGQLDIILVILYLLPLIHCDLENVSIGSLKIAFLLIFYRLFFCYLIPLKLKYENKNGTYHV